MTTIWCEVTSSIRTVETPRDSAALEGGSDDGKSRKSGAKAGTKSEEGSAQSEPDVPPEKELLLCLRPIRDGEAQIEGKLGLGLLKKKKKSPPKEVGGSSPSRPESTKPPKKRRPDGPPEDEPSTKKAATPSQEGDTDAADSLMAINKQANNV